MSLTPVLCDMTVGFAPLGRYPSTDQSVAEFGTMPVTVVLVLKN
jgi:hypothetical protein